MCHRQQRWPHTSWWQSRALLILVNWPGGQNMVERWENQDGLGEGLGCFRDGRGEPGASRIQNQPTCPLCFIKLVPAKELMTFQRDPLTIEKFAKSLYLSVHICSERDGRHCSRAVKREIFDSLFISSMLHTRKTCNGDSEIRDLSLYHTQSFTQHAIAKHGTFCNETIQNLGLVPVPVHQL